MSNQFFHFVVCAGIVPDPLQIIEPQSTGLKNEMLLPYVLDPFGAHALYEAANLCSKYPQSKIWLVSCAPKAKLQQVMMNIAQKAKFELIAIDGSSSGFIDCYEVAVYLAEAINAINDIDKSRLFIFGGWESASRSYGITLQVLGEILGVKEQFYGVDNIEIKDDGSINILERVEGGKHQLSSVDQLPIVIGWATGNLPEPPNNPQVGMLNMKGILPALQRARTAQFNKSKLNFLNITSPSLLRETRVVKDKSVDEIALEIVKWIKE